MKTFSKITIAARILPIIVLCIALTSCAAYDRNIRIDKRQSNLADYLFSGKEPSGPAQKAPLTLPARVGVTFVPGDRATTDIPETTKKQVIDAVCTQLGTHTKYVGGAFAIPSSYLKPRGGISDLERVARQFDVDVVVVLAANQFQKHERNPITAFLDVTIIGQFLIPGNQVDTNTVLEAAVYHVPSRSLIFRADGADISKSMATPYGSSGRAQKDAVCSIEGASKHLVASLAKALVNFEKFDASKAEEIRPTGDGDNASNGGNGSKGSSRDNYWGRVREYKSSGGGFSDITWLVLTGVAACAAFRRALR